VADLRQSGLGGPPGAGFTLANRRTGKREAVPLTWRTAPDFAEHYDPLEYLREWTAAFRASYRAMARSAHAAGVPALARREP
jgi:hypothetical protein